MVDSQNFRRGMEYAFIKLAGAGFAATLFFLIFFYQVSIYIYFHMKLKIHTFG
ncbi:hypothetical protein AAHH67_03545 [Niallia circulans]